MINWTIILGALIVIVCSVVVALAQFSGCAPGFCNIVESSPPASNYRITMIPEIRATMSGDRRIVQ